VRRISDQDRQAGPIGKIAVYGDAVLGMNCIADNNNENYQHCAQFWFPHAW